MPAHLPQPVSNLNHHNPRHIAPPQESTASGNRAPTDGHEGSPISPERELLKANWPGAHLPAAGVGSDAAPEAPSALPPAPPLDASAQEQAFSECGRADQSVRSSTEDAIPGSNEPADSTAENEAIPVAKAELPAAEMPRTGDTNPHEREPCAATAAPAETLYAKSSPLPAEIGMDRTEAPATGMATEPGLSATEALAPAQSDSVPTAGSTGNALDDPLLDLADPDASRPGTAVQFPAASDMEPQASAISKYRPRLRPHTSPPSRPLAIRSEQEQTFGTLEAVLLLTFLPGGWGISLAVLLSRAEGMPENLEVRIGGTTYDLFAIDDKLHAPIYLASGVDIVGSGFAAETVTRPTRRWVRTTRDLHVFSQRPGVSGFASVPRALIGQENVVLCKSHRVGAVQECAKATGSGELEHITGPGVPEGWQCFRAYRPRAPADIGDADDIFLSLNPLPDAAIQLSGGIASARSTWIVGAPPTIRILGTDPSAAEFTIDGHPASPAQSDGWLAPGWDAPGTHTIRFGGLSRTYEIVEINETWPTWATDNASVYFACGAKVSAAAQLGVFVFAGGPRWLLGASAGDIAFAAQSSAGIAIAASPFRPVWSLAARTGGRLLPAAALPFRAPPQMPCVPVAREQIAQWCNLLRGSSAPAEADSKELWRQYRQLARSLRRRSR